MDIFTTDYGRDGGHALDRSYRKVELQSPADLTYLIAKLSHTAREKIDKHFPPDALKGEDKMKAQVEMMVEEYIKRTYSLAKPNLSINGMDTREFETELAKAHEGEDFEPFDSKLAYRIQDLSREIEEHTLQLAELRRNAPTETAAKYKSTIEQEEAAYQAQWQNAQAVRMADAKNTKLDIRDIARLDDIRQTWQASNKQAAELKIAIEKTVNRIDQAQRAEGYMAGS